jgi:SAM-dependent methyltransferase
MHVPNPVAFDAFAEDYDRDFSNTALGQMLRQRVWRVLAETFPAGSHILELACGTGEDAIWLAQRGVTVTATDGSPQMVEQVRAKAEAKGVLDRVHVRHETLQDICASAPPNDLYDGVLSNFGGLNTLPEWHTLGKALAARLRPGARAVLVPMGPWCPWESGWALIHGRPRYALRRLRQPAQATIGASTIPIWYPSLRRLRNDLTPWFDLRYAESLGLWLPPSYLGHLVTRFPTLFTFLNRLESKTASLRPSRGWGDHYITLFERNST